MKRKTREVNVFSMSALDLFASALGAFILLAIIFMPFFPNTGDHPKISEELRKKLSTIEQELASVKSKNKSMQAQNKALQGQNKALQGQNKALQGQNKTLQAQNKASQGQNKTLQAQNKTLQAELDKLRNAPKIQFPHLDLVVVLDTTGSMRGEISSLQKEIAQFTELMTKMTPSFSMGVVEFKDRCDPSSEIRQFPLTSMDASSVTDAQAFVNAIIAGGTGCNDDNPESLAAGLDAAISMSWRRKSEIKQIVVISDNPPYPEFESSSIMAGQTFGRLSGGHKISTVSTSSDGDDYLNRLAQAAGGQFIQGSRSFSTAMLLALAD